MAKINTHVIMSGAEFFNDGFAINPYMDSTVEVDVDQAIKEHAAIEECFKQAGIQVERVGAPERMQDGVYTANWALIHNGKAVMANLPNTRVGEEAFAEKVLQGRNLEIIKLPRKAPFSGQGDALICGKLLFVGSKYRTNARAHAALREIFQDLTVIPVETIPKLNQNGHAVNNPVTKWPDSFFYDLDLALSVITPGLIAWCPEAFTGPSRKIIEETDVEKIEVSLHEAKEGFACNLVSTGETVIMSGQAPKLKEALEAKGLKVVCPEVTELLKGGGFIRCVSLTLGK